MRYSIIENGKVTNHAEADEEFAASQGWIAAGNSRIGDTWDGVKFSAPVTPLEEAKSTLKKRLAEIATEKLSAGFVINGLEISTDADARGLLSLGKIGNKPSRKVVTSSGQRAILTGAQFSDIVAAAADYGQDIMDRWYDLHEVISNATVDTFDSIDVNTGWPS